MKLSETLEYEDVLNANLWLDHSNTHAVAMGCRPYYAPAHEPERADAFKHLVASRVWWLLHTTDGNDELMSTFDSVKFGLYVQDFVGALDLNGQNGINRRDELGKFFGRAIMFEAQRNAHNYALDHIAEIWANRNDPDYVLPWERTS